MGLFTERRRSALPEAYTGVNRPPTSTDMPNKNALAAANTIGKLFQGTTNSSVNTSQVSLSRSNSLASTSRRYQAPRRVNSSTVLDTSSPQQTTPKKNKGVSRSSSLSSNSNAYIFKPPQQPHQSGQHSPLESSSPLNSLTSDASLHQPKRPAPKRSVSAITEDNTKQNQLLTKPKTIRKTVPTAHGLKTIEVPVSEVDQLRTSSLLGHINTYTPRHSSFTVSSINEKHRARQKAKQKDNSFSGFTTTEADKKPSERFNHSFAGISSDSMLLPPSIPQHDNKAKKRVSFTEDSPEHSVVSYSITEFPDQEDDQLSPTKRLGSLSLSDSGLIPPVSPLKSALHHETPTKIIPEPLPGTQANVSPDIDEPIKEEEEEEIEAEEKPTDAISENTIRPEFNVNGNAIESNDTPTRPRSSSSEYVPKQNLQPATNSTTSDISTSITPELTNNTTTSSVNVSTPYKNSTFNQSTATPTTEVNIPAPKVPSPPPIKPSSEIVDKLNRAQLTKPGRSNGSGVRHSSSNANNINNVPYRSPSRTKSKRNSAPVSIPLAHAFERSDALSGFNQGKPQKTRQQPSRPISHSPTLKRLSLRDGEVPTKQTTNTNGAPVRRSQSVMGSKSSRTSNPVVHASGNRPRSSMASRSFRTGLDSTPNESEVTSHRPRSEMGFRSINNKPHPKPTTFQQKPRPQKLFSEIASPKTRGTANSLQPKSSFEKIRQPESNLAFKRLSMRDPPANNAQVSSPQSTTSGADGIGGRGFGLFKSRFDDSDDEDFGSNEPGSRFTMRTLRQPPSEHHHHHQQDTPTKKFGFSRLGNSRPTSTIGAPAALSTPRQQRASAAKYEEPDALRTPSSSINSDKLFEKHLNESKKHFLLNHFDGHSSNGSRKPKKHHRHSEGLGLVAGDGAFGEYEEEPKKKKIGGRLRKLFGSK